MDINAPFSIANCHRFPEVFGTAWSKIPIDVRPAEGMEIQHLHEHHHLHLWQRVWIGTHLKIEIMGFYLNLYADFIRLHHSCFTDVLKLFTVALCFFSIFMAHLGWAASWNTTGYPGDTTKSNVSPRFNQYPLVSPNMAGWKIPELNGDFSKTYHSKMVLFSLPCLITGG